MKLVDVTSVSGLRLLGFENTCSLMEEFANQSYKELYLASNDTVGVVYRSADGESCTVLTAFRAENHTNLLCKVLNWCIMMHQEYD